MLRSLGLLLVATTIFLGEANKDEEWFKNELQCREDVNNGKFMYLYLFCGVGTIFALLQLGAIIFLVWFIKKKLFTHIDEVIEKTHTVMDAVLVTLLPQNVLLEVTTKDGKNKKAPADKKAGNKKSDEEE